MVRLRSDQVQILPNGKTKLRSPTEDCEQIRFVQWLETMKLAFHHIPNSTYTKYWSVKARNKRLGVRKGFPDMIVLVPTKTHGTRTVFIEMKRST